MDGADNCNSADAVGSLNMVSKLVQDIEKKVLGSKIKAKECEELRLLKEKCCDKNAVISLSAFHGIENLVRRKILIGSQTISILISLLPSINQYGALVTTIGRISLLQFQSEISGSKAYSCPYTMQIQHPFITILKYSPEESWFEVYNFVLQLIQMNEDIKIEHKIMFLRPIVHHVFWDSPLKGSKFQIKLFNALVVQLHQKEYLHFILEALLWQPLDIHYCTFLQEVLLCLLKNEHIKVTCGLAPALAEAVNWLIIHGHDPTLWLKTLKTCCEIDSASGSVVLYILTEVIMKTPCMFINVLIDVCKIIIFSSYCSKYVAYKFMAVVLNWFLNPSFLANPMYQTLEEMVEFITEEGRAWKDQTATLNDNEYYQVFGRSRGEVRFAVELILASNRWAEGTPEAIASWLENLSESNEERTLLRLHPFLQGLILCERDTGVVELCLDLIFKLIGQNRHISFSHLCLLFYKLGREKDPTLQKILLFFLPKLAIKKENIPVIIGIIESLKRGNPKIMSPLVIQLYLLLWKADSRTYSYLHAVLHDGEVPRNLYWELNVSRALALKEICHRAPHLHAKDSVGVLSSILNECTGDVSGLPSAIAIEAVTELCKAYVIDVAGAWSAIQPKLRLDKRAIVIKSLCRFFGEIPNLNASEQKHEDLIKDIVPMLWKYTFFKDNEVTRHAFRALSKFPLENLPLKLLPEPYWMNLKVPKDLDNRVKTFEDAHSLPYVPAECWIHFLSEIPVEVSKDGGELVITLLERELTSLPRGLFYLPPEKEEPLSYSYLPSRSLCRALVDHLLHTPSLTAIAAQIVAVLAHKYSKLLPPINWHFLKNFLTTDSKTFCHCLALLAKQGAISTSARCLLDSYFKSADWDSYKLEQVLFTYELLPLLCKAFSFNILQNFLEATLRLTLRVTLSHDTLHFQKVLLTLAETLRNKTVQLSHKTLIARQLENLLVFIPPDHEAMRHYARCATEFPMKSIEQVTSCRAPSEVDGDWLRRAVTIKWAIAMRPDIKEPLAWLSELTEAAAHVPKEQDFIVKTICSVIRGRRDCDHRVWLQELIWRIQASITDSKASNQSSIKVTLFLVDVFVTTVITLSGYDCLFFDGGTENLQLFPQALSALISFPDWSDMLPKVGAWLEKLLKWKDLPQERAKTFVEALFSLREVGSSPSWTIGYNIQAEMANGSWAK